jgi:uncharacterized protein YjhX (UPF0386 family)
MNVSRDEQRALHALAQGGIIYFEKDARGRIAVVQCFNRHGLILAGFSHEVFRKLRSKRAIVSHEGRPYVITRRGLDLVRAQADNR